MLIVALLLLALAIALLVGAGRLRRATGVPEGEVVSSDAGVAGPHEPGKALFSKRYGITGKPDYVVRTSSGLIPVEVKPSRWETEPRDSHLLQVLAYCLLLEETGGERPPYGLLRYGSATFKVDYNADTRAYLLETVEAMRRDADEPDVARSHDNPAKCRSCAYFTVCDQALRSDM